MAQQQIRHIKLWFAGRAGNWPLADYEIDQLKEGFDHVNRQIGGDTIETVSYTHLPMTAKSAPFLKPFVN